MRKAKMPKLIDADAAKNCIDFKPEGFLSEWQEGYLAASMSAVHQIELLPDASEPLRVRIKELESSQPSEEDRAVLWLIREKGWEMARTAKGVWSMDGTPIASPAEEAKKLGWKP